MIGKNDVFTVRVTTNMIIKSVEYAQKSLHYTYNRMGKSNLYDRVRNIVSGVIMENAFKRLIDYHNVHYDLLGHTHWTKKDKYDVGINGHRYDIKGFFIGDPEKIKSVERDKRWLLNCSALVPADQIESRTLKDDDCYVFPFLTGRRMRNIEEIYSLFGPSQEKYLIHAFWDYDWTKNPAWRTLGRMIIESQMREKIHIAIGGQNKTKELVIEKVLMMPMSLYTTNTKFYTLLFIQTKDTPTERLIIKSKEISKKEIIGTFDWGNIWLYDGLVYFTGYMSKREFREKSTFSKRFSKDIRQYAETKTDNRKIRIQELHSLRDILPHNCEVFIP